MTTTIGASATERSQLMPADSMIPAPIASFTQAVSVAAPPAAVWPWLVQMGAGRAGWYSYDSIDNGGVPSSWSILPEHQSVAVGDILPALPGAVDAFVVSALDPDRELVLTVPFPDGEVMVTWDFLLQTSSFDHTRLVVRARLAFGWPGRPSGSRMIERIYRVLAAVPKPLMLALGGFGHGLMEAKMLRGIRHRAEGENGHA